MACALRLARFNVSLDDPSRPDWQKNFFTGFPAPAGAVTALLPVYLHLVGIPIPAGASILEAVYVLFIAFMMVSRIPTYAGKTLGSRVPREWVIPLLLAVALFVALLLSYTFLVLLAITLVYLAMIPWGISRYRSLERADAAGRRAAAAAPEEAAPPAAGDA
jgi:CDP-diacylglycerol--serine O-phosphatidyltransferase